MSAYDEGFDCGLRGGSIFECLYAGYHMRKWLMGYDAGRNDRARREAVKGLVSIADVRSAKPCRCGPDGCADSACPGRDINRHQMAFDRRMAAINTKPEDRT